MLFLQLVDTSYNGYYDLRAKLEIEFMLEEQAYVVSFDPYQKKMYYYNMRTGLLSEEGKNYEKITIDTLDYKFLGLSVINYYPPNHSIYILDGGGGRVHRYDLDSKQLIRMDRSYPMRAFFGFSGEMIGPKRLNIMGGAGEFMRRNQLLSFNINSSREWSEVITTNFNQWDNSFYDLGMYRDMRDKSLYYIRYQAKTLNIYKGEVEEKKGKYTIDWELLERLRLTENIAIKELNGFTDYSQVGKYINISGNYLFDIEKTKLVKWSPKTLAKNQQILAIRATSSTPDSVTYIYFTQLEQSPDGFYAWETVSINEFMGATFEDITLGAFFIRDNQIRWLFLFVALITVPIFIYSFIISKPRRKKVNLIIEWSENTVNVFLDGKLIQFNEIEEIEFWRIINDLHQANISAIELERFDELLFTDYIHKSHVTSKRNALIEKVNNDLDFNFVKLIKSSNDRRRKLLKLNFDTL